MPSNPNAVCLCESNSEVTMKDLSGPQSQVRHDNDPGDVKYINIREVETKLHVVINYLNGKVSDGLYIKISNLFWYI